MLRSFKGTWRWHRKAEGGRPPSVLLSLHSSVVISNNSFIQTIGPVEYGRFLFCSAGCEGEQSSIKNWRLLAVFYLVLAARLRCNSKDAFYFWGKQKQRSDLSNMNLETILRKQSIAEFINQ
jgi:hypothetical protein